MLMLTEVHGMLSLSSVCAHQSFPEVNHQLESRMRGIRKSGSEGGGIEFNRFSLPLSLSQIEMRFTVV